MKKIDATQPAIITFDSLGAPHPPTIRILKSYLREEGLAKRNGMEFDETRLKGLTAKQIPQQDNFSDCGLFLLGYMDKFLENPKEFIHKIVKREYDIEKDWPRMDPSEMRTNLRTLIQKLHAQQENERRLERMEAARKAGKYVGKKEQEPQRKEPESQPSSDPLHADDTHGQLTTVQSGPKQINGTDAGPRTVQTRNEALANAITIDSQEPSVPAPIIPTEDELTSPPKSPTKLATATIPKDPSIMTVDSQPSFNPLIQTQPPEARTPSPELACEIADSQPLVQATEPPSSPSTLPERPLRKEQEEEFEASHDGLPTASSSSLRMAVGEEMEELRARLRRNEMEETEKRTEKHNERERERTRERGRRKSVVEIDD